MKRLRWMFLFTLVFSLPMFVESQRHVNTETHCLGRFLIDLPAGTQVRAHYISLGSTIQTFPSTTPEEFQSRVDTRQQVLQDSTHSQGGTMLVDRDDISSNHITLVSWSSEASHRVYRYEEYQYLPEERVLYVLTGDGTAHAEGRRKAAENQRKYSGLIRYLNPLEIPEEPGFCICEGLIKSNTMNKEEMTVGFFFPQHPDVNMSIMSFVTAHDLHPQSTPHSGVMNALHTRVLRSKNRKWGNFNAVELLLKYKDGGTWFYDFVLKIPSKGNTLHHPFMTISLETGAGHDTDGEGNTVKPAFANDTEALQFWDSIVSSLRVRPGT